MTLYIVTHSIFNTLSYTGASLPFKADKLKNLPPQVSFKYKLLVIWQRLTFLGHPVYRELSLNAII